MFLLSDLGKAKIKLCSLLILVNFIIFIGLITKSKIQFPQYFIIRKDKKEMFMSFEEFKEGLGSWAEPLKNFLNSKTFQDIYKYVKT